MEEEREEGVGRWVLAAVVAAVLAIVVAVVAAGGGEEDPGPRTAAFPAGTVPAAGGSASLRDAARRAGCELGTFPVEGREERTGEFRYRTSPPTSGDAWPQPADDGAYAIDPPRDSMLVHSLKHSRVIYSFDPDLPDGALGSLKALYDEDRDHIIVVPREMEFAIAATAWTARLGCRDFNRATWDAIRAFRDRYRDNGPEFVP